MNLIEEIDVYKYLIFKKDGEDGPDVKGGQLDALIVHASRVQKICENGKFNRFISFCSTVLFVRIFIIAVAIISPMLAPTVQILHKYKCFSLSHYVFSFSLSLFPFCVDSVLSFVTHSITHIYAHTSHLAYLHTYANYIITITHRNIY